MTFLEKYPVSTTEALHFPLMFAENLKKLRIPGIPYAKLDFLYRYGNSLGMPQGTIRTALSRMNKSGFLSVIKTDDTTRYRVSPLQVEAMMNMQKKVERKNSGFIVVVYTFEKEQEKERIQIRSLLEYLGFVRFAQNAYINIKIEESVLRQRLEESGLEGNVYLFYVESLKDQELSKMAAAWKVPERTAILEDFFSEMKLFLESTDGTPGDLFFRHGLAWVTFYIHIHSKELPLPDKLLPRDYPYGEIYEYLRKRSIREGQNMMRHYIAGNR
jgi:DNA-binding transcriptional regulator PaaX